MPLITVGSGLSSQIVVLDESTYGVAPTLTGFRSYEFKTETLELKKTTVQGEGLAAGHVYERTKRRVLTQYDVSGALTLDCPTRQLGYWCQYMVGDFTETPAQVGSSGIYKTVFNPKSSFKGHSFCLQKGVPTADNATVEPFTYVGGKLSSWTLKASTGAIAELTFNITARNELGGSGNGDPLNGSVPALASPWGVPTTGLGESMFHFREATLFTGGTPALASGVTSLTGATAAAQIKDITLGQALGLDETRFFLGSSGFKAEPIENNYRKLTGSFTAEWQSTEAWYNAFSAESTTSLELTFTGPTVSTSNYLLDIIIPNIRLEGESPKVGGPAVVTQAVNFTGLDDEATTPIQITYQSEDTAL